MPAKRLPFTRGLECCRLQPITCPFPVGGFSSMSTNVGRGDGESGWLTNLTATFLTVFGGFGHGRGPVAVLAASERKS